MIDKIIEILQSYCAIEEEIAAESELKSLSIDSLTFVTMLIDLEENFDIEFDLEELDIGQWTTVKDFVIAVEAKINEKED